MSINTSHLASNIIHVDMDAFYASVEIRDNPDLIDKPVIVGGSPERRGVVSAASYAARQFGVHSAMPMVRALRLCPQAIRLPVRMDLYANVSHQIHAIFSRFTSQIEPLALDEAFLDVSASVRLFGNAETIARQIKDQIQQELSLTASVGVAPTKYVAKVASDIEKPDGFVTVQPHAVQRFLDPMPVSRLWGAGKKTVMALERLGMRRIEQVRKQSSLFMESHFGKWGLHLWELAQGIDPRPVISDSQAKSISHETTFSDDITEQDIIEAWLLHLTEQVASRLRQRGYLGRTIHLKLRYSDFTTRTRSVSLPKPTNSTTDLWQTVRTLLRDHWSSSRQPLRLIGMGVSGISDKGQSAMQQSDLFTSQTNKHGELDQLADTINRRFGKTTLQRGRARYRHDIE